MINESVLGCFCRSRRKLHQQACRDKADLGTALAATAMRQIALTQAMLVQAILNPPVPPERQILGKHHTQTQAA